MLRAIAIAVLTLFACAAGPAPEPKPEPVAWHVCYDKTGIAVNWDGECDNPSIIVWDLPILVYIDDSFPRPELALQSLFWWNDKVGVKLFDITLNLDDAVVMLYSNNLTMPVGAGGVAEHFIHPFWGRRFLVNVLSIQSDDMSTLCHEFGHVLGLAHDPGGLDSIMQPKAYLKKFDVTKTDLDYLQALYVY